MNLLHFLKLQSDIRRAYGGWSSFLKILLHDTSIHHLNQLNFSFQGKSSNNCGNSGKIEFINEKISIWRTTFIKAIGLVCFNSKRTRKLFWNPCNHWCTWPLRAFQRKVSSVVQLKPKDGNVGKGVDSFMRVVMEEFIDPQCDKLHWSSQSVQWL